jgi:hypothetical protein
MTDTKEQYYRVFAYGPRHGMQISERLRKDAAENRRQEMKRYMPQSDVRVEKVDAQGRANSTGGPDS